MVKADWTRGEANRHFIATHQDHADAGARSDGSVNFVWRDAEPHHERRTIHAERSRFWFASLPCIKPHAFRIGRTHTGFAELIAAPRVSGCP